MAKLSAHGIELLRIERERKPENDPDVMWERVTRSYRSDGKILQKRDVRFAPDSMDPDGRRYSWGWKLASRVKRDHDIVGAYKATRDSVRTKPDMGWVILVDVLGE